ncbi:unnamed protein product [Linum trigynum]|uniref:Uncharacterized protein n=1 Tax=Linum trigynum TaxID=586398 RepID=A0AAV2EGU4_9ROSI
MLRFGKIEPLLHLFGDKLMAEHPLEVKTSVMAVCTNLCSSGEVEAASWRGEGVVDREKGWGGSRAKEAGIGAPKNRRYIPAEEPV